MYFDKVPRGPTFKKFIRSIIYVTKIENAEARVNWTLDNTEDVSPEDF